MNKLFKLFLVLALAAGVTFAQASWTTTTLSGALPGEGPNVPPSNLVSFSVASATGISAPSFSVPNSPTGNQTALYIDAELFLVTGVNGTFVTALRGQNGSHVSAHASATIVYVGSPNQFGQNDKFGACGSGTSTGVPVILPYINATNGNFFNCLNGQWVNSQVGTMDSPGVNTIRAFCTGTVGSAETEYLNGAACSGATTSTARYVVTQRGFIGSLYVVSSAAVTGGTGKDVMTVYKNASATAVTCTMAASATTCNDTTHGFAVAPGDVLTFQWVTATSDQAANIGAAVTQF